MSKAGREIAADSVPQPATPHISPVRLIACLAIIAGITFFAFYPSLRNGFTNWDDGAYVTENQEIRLQHPGDLAKLLTFSYTGNYHPLTMLCHAAEFALFGLDAGPYHFVNLIFHCLNAFFVFFLIRRLRKSVFAAFAVALLFAVHPLRVESVAWISELKDVLSSFFYLLSLLAYLSYLKNKGWKPYTASLLTLVLSLLSKPMAVSLPIVLLLIDYLKARKIDRKSLIEKIPFFAAAAACAFMAYRTQISMETIHHHSVMSGIELLCVPFYGIVFYLYKTIMPIHLSALYGYATAGDPFMHAWIYASPIVVIALAATVFFCRRASRALVFGSLYFLVTLLPVLQIVHIGDAAVAERYTYIPMIGVYFMFAAGVEWLLKMPLRKSRGGRAAVFAAFGAIILAFSFMTNARCKVWKNSFTLWNNVVDQFPSLFIPHNQLGEEYRKTGRYDSAVAEYTKAISCTADAYEAYYNRGTVYRDHSSLYDLAIADFSTAIRINPAYAPAYNNMGTVYYDKGSNDTAFELFTKAISLDSGYAESYSNRGLVMFRLKRYEDAIAEFNRALQLNPGFATTYNSRGVSRAAIGDFSGAAADFRKAIELQPDYPGAERNLSFILKKMNGR